ncbi:hypothetical protein OROHE_026568 [Orobanche hederae]
MEFGSSENTQDKSCSISKHENPKEQPDPSKAIPKVHTLGNNEGLTHGSTLGEVNMEATVTADEVTRAGGFGATDDLSSIIPVASDFTDLEDHFRKAKAYEDSEDKTCGGQSDLPIDSLEGVEVVTEEGAFTSDEVIRAGGFGAKDDISSFLPVASDFTDIEANLRGAREYEDLSEEIHHPGLGWTSEPK